MAVSVGGMRASRYPTCFATDVSSRDDSLVVLESVGRPHNTVLRGKDMDCIKHRLAGYEGPEPSGTVLDEAWRGWRQRILAEPGS
jgi:hypothetical protein